MIRINLLGTAKPKKGKRVPISFNFSGEGANIVVVAAVLAAITLLANGLWYWKLNRDHERITTELRAAENENISLAAIKSKYLEREKQKNDYKRRVEVIDDLRAKQSGPVNLLNMIGETVNNTDAVWLSTMKDEGNSINIEGMALSVNAVANLMQNLKKTNYFKSVEIKESYQDDTVKDMQAFIFSLTCEKQSDRAPAPPAPPAPAAGKKS
jgi:Tfp pilus assembly protein PilN